MTLDRRRLLLWLRQGATGFGLTLLFVYFTFPWDVVRQRLEAELAEGLSSPGAPAQVAIGRLGPSFLTGVVLDRVMLSRADPAGGAPKSALLPELRGRLALWPLLGGRREVSFSAKALGGRLQGSVIDGKKLNAVALDGSGLQLGEARDLLGFFGAGTGVDLSGLDLAGTAALKGDLTFVPNDFASLKGKVDLTVEKALIRGGTVAEIDLPTIDLGKIQLQARLVDGRLDVDRFKIESSDVGVEADGLFLTLNQNLPFSMPHGKVRVHFGDELQKRIPYLGLGLSAIKQPDHDGFYSLPLGGTLRNPKLM